MAKVYEIVSQQPQVILEGGIPTQGYLIRARLVDFNEMVEVYVTRLDPAIVDTKVREILDARNRLAELGSE